MGGHSKGAVHREELPQTALKPQLVVAGRRRQEQTRDIEDEAGRIHD